MKPIQLGCIADDFTGATDLANNLVRAGMRVLQTIGVPEGPLDVDVDAVVVALKSRTIPAADAVAQSLVALRWLQAAGSRQIYFKYCSTFDSTPQGNIGPVTEALMDALGCDFTIATPAFPDNGRTVFKGHLFVGDVLLSDSGMKDHPLTPMRDANLVRVLQAIGEGKDPHDFLVVLGHAGWAPGQLEQELAQNAWLTVPADPELIFGVAPEQRYEAALALLGVALHHLVIHAGHG